MQLVFSDGTEQAVLVFAGEDCRAAEDEDLGSNHNRDCA